MLFSNTKENDALAAATVAKLKADARIESNRAGLFRICGYSVFVACLSIGSGMAFLGYSSVKKAHSSSDEIAKVLVKALSGASITAKGEVKLLPGAIVSLRPDATVMLDPHTSVKAEPVGTVRAGQRFDRLANKAEPRSGGDVVTTYTVLKEVKYAKGAVITAWTFAPNKSAEPNRQRCYYLERSSQGLTSGGIELAINRYIVSHVDRPKIDIATAATNCVWFSAQGEV
jgi:hypothetical protein